MVASNQAGRTFTLGSFWPRVNAQFMLHMQQIHVLFLQVPTRCCAFANRSTRQWLVDEGCHAYVAAP
jgi:hypothetical protein